MPEPTPSEPAETVRRQIHRQISGQISGQILRQISRQIWRLRWRRNVHALAGGLLLVVAVGGGAVTAILLLGLLAGTLLFGVGASVTALAAVACAVVVAAGTRRRWLGPERAPRWIDREAGLEGRLATLVELERCGTLPADPFFLPLLVEENRRRLPSWHPAALVPRRVPRGALAAAVSATAMLLLALLLAPRLRPPAPEVFYGDVVPEGAGRRLAVPGRVLMAPSRAPADVERRATLPSPSLTADLQERIRRRLWGRDWDATREAMARMAAEERVRGGESERRSPPGQNGDGADAERSWDLARTSPSRGDTGAPERAAGGEAGEREDGQAAPRDAKRRVPAEDAPGTGGAARGAGTATDPRLLGPATDPSRGAGTFDLPIVARVRSLGGGPRPPSGEGPPAAPDARPDLGAGQRRDAPVARIDVPAAYEDVVRRVFAHRTGNAVP